MISKDGFNVTDSAHTCVLLFMTSEGQIPVGLPRFLAGYRRDSLRARMGTVDRDSAARDARSSIADGRDSAARTRATVADGCEPRLCEPLGEARHQTGAFDLGF